MLVPVSTRVALPLALCRGGSSGVWSAAPLAVACPPSMAAVYSVISLEVCLAGHPSCLQVAARGSRRRVRIGGAPAGRHEDVERVVPWVCLPGDGPRSVTRFGVSGVVVRASDSAWALGGLWVDASPDIASPAVHLSLRCAGAVDEALPV